MKFFNKKSEKIIVNGYASTPLVLCYPLSFSERVIGAIICILCLSGLWNMAHAQRSLGEDLRRTYSVLVENTPTTSKPVAREDMTRKTLVPAKAFHCILKHRITENMVESPTKGFDAIFSTIDKMLSFDSHLSDTVSSYEIFKSNVNEKKGKTLMSCSLGTFQFFKRDGKIYRMIYQSYDLKEKYILSNEIVPISWKEGDAE